MTVYGDDEPEDAWHPDDAVPELVDNLRRRLALLFIAGGLGDYADELDIIAAAVVIARRRRLNARAVLRADQLDDDIAYVRGRLP